MGVKRNQKASQGRSQGTGEVEAGRIEGDGIRELRARDHLRHNGLPCRAIHRRADIQQKRENQQDPRRNDVEEGENAEDCHRRQHPCLPEDEQPSAIEDIGRRPGQQAEDDYWKAGCGLHQCNEQGRRREHRHQPGARRILHPSPQVGHNGGQPQIAENRYRKRFEAAELDIRLQLIRLQCRHGQSGADRRKIITMWRNPCFHYPRVLGFASSLGCVEPGQGTPIRNTRVIKPFKRIPSAP